MHSGPAPRAPRSGLLPTLLDFTSLPDHCLACRRHVSLTAEPWHWLSCTTIAKGEQTRRHDAVVDAIARVARLVAAQVKKEVVGLVADSGKQRPDLQIAFPGRMLLTDVSVSSSLTAARMKLNASSASDWQTRKNIKYQSVAAQLGAELLNVCVEACGGMASDAVRLVQAIGEEGARWSMGTWKSADIERQLLGAIAVAVQRSNALMMLSGFTRMMRVQPDGSNKQRASGWVSRRVGEGAKPTC